MNASSSPEQDLLNILAEEFLTRHRRGERPDPRDYAARHPHLAERIHDLFPTLILMEKLTPEGRATVPSEAAPLRRLGDYRLVRELGRGGMGIVYEAVQESLGRRVAVKVLPPSLCYGKPRERFEREAKAAARLHHTNIVPVFGVGEHDDTPFYVMQLIDGRGLDAVLRDAKERCGAASTSEQPTVADPRASALALNRLTASFQPATATPSVNPPTPSWSMSPPFDAEYFRGVARLGEQAADALAYAHTRGVLHRDIKPANLLLDSQGMLWITDFGLAKIDDSADLTEQGDIVGTLRYLAPERMRGQCDARADIYSLGVTLYELLTLQPAFGGDDRASVLEQIERHQVTPLRHVLPALPADLETIVDKAMAREPADRYINAAALADDLRRFLADRPILARRSSTLEKLRRWRRRNPIVAASLGLTALALVAVAVVSIFFALHAQRVAGELDQQQKTTASALEQTRKQRNHAERRLTENYLAHALNLCAKEHDILHGLHWMTRALETVPEDAGDLERVLRINLAAWSRMVHPLEEIHPAMGPPQTRYYLSPDGVVVVAVPPAAKTARLWDVMTGAPVGVPLTHASAIKNVAFSPEGKKLLLVSEDGLARLWALPAGVPVGPFFHTAGINALAVAADGQNVYISEASLTTWFWDPVTGQHRGRPLRHPLAVLSAQFSPDARLLLTCCVDNKIRLWKTATSELAVQPLPHPRQIRGAIFSPDGRMVLSRCLDNTVRLWDTATGKAIGSPLEHPSEVMTTAFRSDGRAVLTGCLDGTARLWSVPANRLLLSLSGDSSWIKEVAFHSKENRIRTIGWAGTLQEWDAVTGRLLGSAMRFPSTAFAGCVRRDATIRVISNGSIYRYRVSAPYPQGERRTPPGTFHGLFPCGERRLVVLAAKAAVSVWDAATSQPCGPPLQCGKPWRIPAVSPDGHTLLILSHNDRGQLWDIDSGKPKGAPIALGGFFTLAAFSPDSQMLLIGTMNKRARLWHTANGQPAGPILPHDNFVMAAAFSPDSRLLLTGDGDGKIHAWDRASAPLPGWPLKLPDPAQLLVFRADGAAFATIAGKTVRVWDTETRQPLSPPLTHPDPVFSFAFTRDWRTVFTNGTREAVRLWDLTTGKPLRALLSPAPGVMKVLLSRDERLLLTGHSDHTGRFWDAATGQPLGPPLPLLSTGSVSDFTADERNAITVNVDGLTRLWPVPQPIAGSPQRLRLWLQVITNMELDEQGVLHVLDAATWRERRRQLHEQGGPP